MADTMPCSYCGEDVSGWVDKHGDLFTEICKDCATERLKEGMG